MKKISRFIFNFRSACNMHCPYCYLPFVDSEAGGLSLWKRIIDILSEYSPDLVTFGGGDPFIYDDFINLLQYCKKFNFKTHIDTNAIGLKKEDIKKTGKLIDLIGLPLDGNRQRHDIMRNYNGHYDIICEKLAMLDKYQVPVKINTVLSDKPSKQLYEIAEILKNYANIKQWFIYQYWHFEKINESQLIGESNFHFSEEYTRLREVSKVKEIYYSTVSERSSAYVFVSSLGNLYTIGEDAKTYVEVANIFDDKAKEYLDGIKNRDEIQKRTRLKCC